MGWKQYYRKTFEQEYENVQNWGDLSPIKLTIGTDVYYTVGYTGAPAGWKFSPKIQHPQGVKTRITVRYFFWVQQGAVGKASIGIVFYKNDETSKDPSGYDLHGASHSLSSAPSANFAEKHELVMEYDGGNKITYSVDGQKLGETTLELPLVNFKIAVATDQATNGDVGILIYEVVAEYYDQWEDWINQIYGIMQWMIPLMIVMMIVPMIVSALRPRKKTEEERKVIVVPG